VERLFWIWKFSASPSWPLWPVGHIGGAPAYRGKVAPQSKFIYVFLGFVLITRSAFHLGGSKPKVFSEWFSVCHSCFLDVWCPPSQFLTSDASRAALPVRCRHIVENAEIGLAEHGTSRICRKTLELLATDPTFTEDQTYHPSNTTWIDISRRDCATWESYRHEMAHKYQQVPSKLCRSNPDYVSWP